MNHISRFLLIFGIAMGLIQPTAASEAQHETDAERIAPYEDIDAMREQVKTTLEQHYRRIVQSGDLEVHVSRIDPRLKLATCSQRKAIKINGNQTKTANISVRVSCNGESPWSIFVPARIDVLQEVVTTTRDIYKDEILKPEDLTLVVRNTSSLGFGYTNNIKPLLGNAVTRNINAGSVIRLAHVSEPLAITRGDKIVLESGTGGLSVAASAIAMSDGKVGDQIRVKNAESKRIIEVFVVAPGRAAANL
ncbi:MAG TPA: flagellar basal body P-ring formation chaperone FlgA [Marinagarivorans sp.]